MIDPYQNAIARNVMNVTKQAMPASSMMSSMMYAIVVFPCESVGAFAPIVD
jgi:hypothetical protein